MAITLNHGRLTYSCVCVCVCVCFFTVINKNIMLMMMLAMPTTVWSAEMARVMDVAVYDIRMMENMKIKNASADAFRPTQEIQTHQNARSTSDKHEWRKCVSDQSSSMPNSWRWWPGLCAESGCQTGPWTGSTPRLCSIRWCTRAWGHTHHINIIINQSIKLQSQPNYNHNCA